MPLIYQVIGDSGQIIIRDKVAIAIQRLRGYADLALQNNSEGYYLAFSGGKDSQVIYHLAAEAGVPFRAYFSPTTVDPPQLKRFIREHYPDVVWNKLTTSMWALIIKKGIPPTRRIRYCCQELKERGGEGRFVVTGVRWAESTMRAANRGKLEIQGRKKGEGFILNSDNEDDRKLFEVCQLQGKRILNPIVDWEDDDIWEYLNTRKIPHCELYDIGFKRIGCIGCPMSTGALEEMRQHFPQYLQAYKNTYEKMIQARLAAGKPTKQWKNADDVINWLYQQKSPERPLEGQEVMDEFEDE